MSAVSLETRLGLQVLAGAALLGIVGDLLLRAMPLGLNAFLCATALVAVATWLVRRNRVPVSPDTPWLAAAALLIACTFVARDSAALHALDALGLVILLAVAMPSLRGGALRGGHAWDYVRAALDAAATAAVGVFPLIGRDVAWREVSHGGRLGQVRAVALGAVVAFPLLIVFGSLFASADVVFRDLVTQVFAVDFHALLSHTFLITVFATLAAGYFRGALLRRGSSREEESGFSIGLVPVATALGLVDALFLVFVVIQLRYLFGGAQLIATTTGLTYAEYARRGFFELVAAAALTLPLLVTGDWVLRKESSEQQRTFRHLAVVLLLLLVVVMASALQRMRLYVDAFGLSEIRLYSTAFMLYVAGVCAWFAWTTLRGDRRRFAFGSLVQGFAVLAGLHLLNPDAFIVRTNLARSAARPFDGRYAASLGADAVPALLDALPGLAPPERCRVAHGLAARRTALQRDDWRTWNFARVRARRLLDEQGESLRTVACPPSRS